MSNNIVCLVSVSVDVLFNGSFVARKLTIISLLQFTYYPTTLQIKSSHFHSTSYCITFHRYFIMSLLFVSTLLPNYGF